MSRPRQGTTVAGQLAADELAGEQRQNDEMIAALLGGRASPYLQRRAARLLCQLLPRSTQEPPQPRASQAIVKRVEAAIAEHGSAAAAYRAVAAEDGKEIDNIKRQYLRARKAEAQLEPQFADESRRAFFRKG